MAAPPTYVQKAKVELRGTVDLAHSDFVGAS
jgi:hypothetical protein